VPQQADLANQRKALEEFVAAKGLAGVEFIECGGLSASMDEIGRREVKMLILAHRDHPRFEWFEHYAKTHAATC
jgi:putative resolvase